MKFRLKSIKSNSILIKVKYDLNIKLEYLDSGNLDVINISQL